MKLKKNLTFCIILMIFSMMNIISFASGDSKDVARVADIGYKTIAEAIEAIEISGDIDIIESVEVKEPITIPIGKNITINLNGKTITGVDTKTVSYELIKNNGTLTIEDTVGNGKIALSATTDRDWNAYSSVIANHQGTVIINGGTIEHIGGTDMAYAIDNLTNGNGGNAILTINGGKLTSSYRAIRQFGNSTTCENILTINGGEIISTSSNKGAVWLTSANIYRNKATLNINGGTVSAVYVSVSVKEIDNTGEYIMGDATGIRLNINEECVTSKVSYGNIAAKVGEIYYSTLEEAVVAVETSGTIEIIGDIELEETLEISDGKDITIDLNNHTISAPSKVLFVKNAKLKVTGTGIIKETSPYYGAIMLSGSDNENDVEYTKLYIDKDVKLIGWSPIFIRETDLYNGYGIVIDIYGTLEGVKDTSDGDGFGIYINGYISESKNCPIINIYEGAQVSGTEIGIYAGGYAIWNINGATIKGQTAIYQKAGELNISDGVFEANGEQKDYVYNGNGANATGDAVVIDYCNYPGGAPIINITDGNFKSANNQAVASYIGNIANESEKIKHFISGGYYSSVSEELLALDKMLVDSDKEGYLYKVVDLEMDVTSKADVQAPTVEVPEDILPEGVTISGDLFVAQENVLQEAGRTLVQDGIVSQEEAIEALQEQLTGDRLAEVTIVIRPYIDIEITGFESGDTNKLITLDISAKYDVVATTASGDEDIITESGDSQNAVVVKENQPLSVKEAIEITIGLPEGFAEPNSTLYVHHTKNNVTYVYEAKVDRDGKTATFVNPHGFSEFIVSTENGAVKNSTTGTIYEKLADAISEIENGQTIVLLKDNNEAITISEEIIIKLDKAGKVFGGSIVAENGYERSTAASGNIVTYTFTKKTQDSGNASDTGKGSGGGSGTVRYVVRFNTNGGTEIEKVKVERNEKLQKPDNPIKKGYVFEGWFVDEDCKEAYDFNTKVKNGFTLYAKWNETKEEEIWKNPFTDVKENDWFYEAVKFANENKLFNGVSSTEFGANVSMTRAMLVTVLYRLDGEPATNRSIPFADVDMSMYYANAVIWAKQHNIVNGVDETNFAPDAKVTREQLVTILYRYAEYKGKDLSIGENTNILSYDDFNELSEYAIPAMQWACGSGIITGRTISTIAPKGTATRAEVATMLMRFVRLGDVH